MPGFSVHHYLHEFAQTHLHSVSDAIQPSHYLSPPSLSFIFSLASGSPFPMSQFFASGGEYWRFSFSISPSNEYSGLISFRIYWFELFAVQGTFKNLLQHHSLKASILWHSTFFVIQHSHPYMTTENTITFLERCSYFKVYKWIIHYQCPGSFFICSDLFCNLQSQFSFLVCWNFKLKFLRLFEILDYPPLNMAEIGH